MGDLGRDIQARAFKFGVDVVKFCDAAASTQFITCRLLGQLFDTSTSIGANLAEASAGQSKPDFIAKTSIALKEAREARFWLALIVATRDRLKPAALSLGECGQIVSILTVIVRKARSNPDCGKQWD